MSHRPQPTVLVVEDEAEHRRVIADSLEALGFAVTQAVDAATARVRLDHVAYDGLVVDLRLPDADGIDLLGAAIARHPETRAVVTAGWGSVEEAARAIDAGAIDFFIKPFQLTQLAHVLHTSINERRLRQENAELRARLQDRFSFSSLIGQSATMRQVFSSLELVSPMDSTVLISGETGTGKELLARTIHFNSPRRDQHFVAFNAAVVPEQLIEAELFGHARSVGPARAGRFELAHQGTLFIDEVSSLPLSLQTKLLRVLQEGEIRRRGEPRPFRFDIRLIAATNVDLRTLVREGTFREDLFQLLNVFSISLPPLRSRREDIALLANHFVLKSCQSNGLPNRTLSQPTLRMLMDYEWPGNIRQLENAVEHAVAISGTAQEIEPPMLPEDVRNSDRPALLAPVTIPDEGLDFAAVITQLERELIIRGLEKTGGNKRQAARLLNLSRTTLIDKLERLGSGADTFIG